MIRLAVFLIPLMGIFFVSCADGIVSECPAEQKIVVNATFSSIQENVFGKSCALSGCHTGSNPQSGLNLTPGVVYANTVNKIAYADVMYIKPGSADESYLFMKINAETSAMPPTGKLKKEVIDSIRVWINNGALNN